MTSALVIGEALVDIVRPQDGEDAEHPGGSPANVALGLARLGREVALTTWIGQDARGQLLREHLQGSGVQLTTGSDQAQRTSTALAELDAGGTAHYTFDLDWQVPAEHTPTADHVHVGSIAATIPPGGADVLRTAQEAHAHSTVSYDPNLRPTIMGSPEEVRERVEALVAAADLVKVSDEDLDWLYPGQDVTDIARRWQRTGPAVVIVTRGGDGSLAVTGHDEMTVASNSVEVVDTVGAGDSYMAGLIDALWSADLLGAANRGQLCAIDTDVLRSAMMHAARLAAITVGRAGADLPTREDVESIGAGS